MRGRTSTNVNYTQKYFQRVQNQKSFLIKLAKDLEINKKEDWLSVNKKKVTELGGKHFLSLYKGDLLSALCKLYPSSKSNDLVIQRSSLKQSINSSAKITLPQLVENFPISNDYIESSPVPPKQIEKKNNIIIGNERKNRYGFWDKIENQRQFLEDFAKHNQIESLDQWYNVSNGGIRSFGGSRLLGVYNGNFTKALKSIYPDYSWNFLNSQKAHKYDHINSKEFILHFQRLFKILRKEDWYRISVNQLKIHHKGGLSISKKGGIIQYLQSMHPDQHFRKLHDKQKRSTQRWLFICVSNLFPNVLVLEDYFYPQLQFISGHLIQLDIFIPSLNFSIEYNGEQHFDDLPSAFNPLELSQSRDLEKQQICKAHNISLISLPFWLSSVLFPTLLPSVLSQHLSFV